MDGMQGHNAGPTTEAETLLDTFERVPAEIDAATVESAITLVKQMKLAADDLDKARKDDAADLRERLADQERPYKLAHERLEEARQAMLERIGAYLQAAGKGRERNSLGIMARRNVTIGWEIEDESKLPLGCWSPRPDPEKIGRMVDDGLDVPGVRRVETVKTIVS